MASGRIVHMWIKLTDAEVQAQQALLERELDETSVDEQDRKTRAHAIKRAPPSFRRRELDEADVWLTGLVSSKLNPEELSGD